VFLTTLMRNWDESSQVHSDSLYCVQLALRVVIDKAMYIVNIRAKLDVNTII